MFATFADTSEGREWKSLIWYNPRLEQLLKNFWWTGIQIEWLLYTHLQHLPFNVLRHTGNTVFSRSGHICSTRKWSVQGYGGAPQRQAVMLVVLTVRVYPLMHLLYSLGLISSLWGGLVMSLLDDCLVLTKINASKWYRCLTYHSLVHPCTLLVWYWHAGVVYH